MKHNTALTPLLLLVGLMGTLVELTPAFAPAPLVQQTNCSGANPCPVGCTPSIVTLTVEGIPARGPQSLNVPKFNPGVTPGVPAGSTLKAARIQLKLTPTSRSIGFENTNTPACSPPQIAFTNPAPLEIGKEVTVTAPHTATPIFLASQGLGNPLGVRHAFLPFGAGILPGFDNVFDFAALNVAQQQCPQADVAYSLAQVNAYKAFLQQYPNVLPAELPNLQVGGYPNAGVLTGSETGPQSGFCICWPDGPEVAPPVVCVDSVAALAFYQGAGNWTLNAQSTDFFNIGYSSAVCSGFNNFATRILVKVAVDVTYTFCPPCVVTAGDSSIQACVGGLAVNFCLPISATCGTFVCTQGPPANPLITNPAPGNGGGTFTVADSCTTPTGGTGCTVRYTPPGPGYAGPFSFVVPYTATATGNAGGTCSDNGFITVNLCKVDVGPASASICAGQSRTVCLPITLGGSCSTLDCSKITVTQPVSGVTASVVPCPTGGCALLINTAGVGAGVNTVQIPYKYEFSLGAGLPTCSDNDFVTISICRITAPPASLKTCVGGRSVSVCLQPTATCGGVNVPIPCDTITFTNPPNGEGTVTGPSAACSGAVCAGGSGCCLTYNPPNTLPPNGLTSFTYTAKNPTDPTCQLTATVTVNLCQVNADNACANVCPGGSVTFCLPISTAGSLCGTVPCSTPGVPTDPGVLFTVPANSGTMSFAAGGCGTCTGCCVTYTAPAGIVANTVTIPYTARATGTPSCSDTGTITINICRITAGNVSQSICAGCPTTFCLPIGTTGTACAGVSTCPTVPCQLSTAGGPGVEFNTPVGQGAMSFATSGCGTCAGCCVTYTPPASLTGISTVTIPYTARATGTGCAANGTITLTVCQVTTTPLEIDLCQCDPQVVIDPLGTNHVSVVGGTSCGIINCHSLSVTSPDPSCGVATVDSDCANGASPCTECKILFTPNANFIGSCTFTYTVALANNPCCIGTGQITVNVNCCPIAVDDCIPPPAAGATITLDPLANDAACDGGGLDCGDIGDLVIDITDGPDSGTLVPVTLPADPAHVPPLPARPGFQYIASNPFPPTGDRICYTITNTCGCTSAPACMTISLVCDNCPRNRDECASLLLYPEYDNHPGKRTLITITDGCCGAPGQNTKVELIFINRNGCFEFNRTYSLTPCDTLTLITSAVAPANFQGYLYVFAKNSTNSAGNPNGTPIVFNHLIGQSMAIDGITNFEYAINAVGFKGIGNEFDENDDDHDGIRDLNGPGLLAEYEAAPEKILIPRFFGQDPESTDPYNSEMVLVALSGGSEFTTLVDISGYNDNEQKFSSFYSFQCWDKVALRDLSSGTLQTTLINLGDNPNEIVGWPVSRRKSGWMTLNGLVANSAAETILDPAIYAVLIERGEGGLRLVADLPWEFCFQTNGDLLPHSVLGDGPNPVNNDHQ